MRSIEEICGRILAEVEYSNKSLRSVVEQYSGRLGLQRGLLNALCLGVLRNYKLVSEAVKQCNRRYWLLLASSTKHGKWTRFVAAYEALFRRKVVKLETLERYLPRRLAECLYNTNAKDVYNESSGLKRLSVKYSVPLWVVRILSEVEPLDVLEKLLESFQHETPLWIRINRRVTSVERAIRELEKVGIVARPDPVLDDVLEVVSLEPGSLSKISREKYYVMDRSSCLVAHLASSVGKPVFLDSFSSPGNKLAHIVWRTNSIGVGVELSLQRLEQEKRLLSSQKVWHSILVNSDAQSLPLRSNSFEVSIVDPDCTSIGRLGHSPETRLFLEQTGPQILARLVRLQERGLREAIRATKPGGTIIYFTCTLTLQENELIVEKLAGEGLVEVIEARPVIGLFSKYMPRAQRLYPFSSRSIGGFVAKMSKTQRV